MQSGTSWNVSLARPERTVEDRLREEYFDLLPAIRRVVDELEAEVRHCLVPISLRLDEYERLVVTSRVKECESALDSLRRRQEGATFDSGQPELYSLDSLNDLAGVRVLAFPRGRLAEADRKLRDRFPSWTADPVPGDDENDDPIALTYFGYGRASDRVRAEYQIVPMLTALFWEVEHSVIYKPSPSLKGVARSLEMQQRTRDVLKGLKAFEDEFANLIRHDPLAEKKKRKKKK
jgi:hypothetical protein